MNFRFFLIVLLMAIVPTAAFRRRKERHNGKIKVMQKEIRSLTNTMSDMKNAILKLQNAQVVSTAREKTNKQDISTTAATDNAGQNSTKGATGGAASEIIKAKKKGEKTNKQDTSTTAAAGNAGQNSTKGATGGVASEIIKAKKKAHEDFEKLQGEEFEEKEKVIILKSEVKADSKNFKKAKKIYGGRKEKRIKNMFYYKKKELKYQKDKLQDEVKMLANTSKQLKIVKKTEKLLDVKTKESVSGTITSPFGVGKKDSILLYRLMELKESEKENMQIYYKDTVSPHNSRILCLQKNLNQGIQYFLQLGKKLKMMKKLETQCNYLYHLSKEFREVPNVFENNYDDYLMELKTRENKYNKDDKRDKLSKCNKQSKKYDHETYLSCLICAFKEELELVRTSKDKESAQKLIKRLDWAKEDYLTYDKCLDHVKCMPGQPGKNCEMAYSADTCPLALSHTRVIKKKRECLTQKTSQYKC